MSQRKKSCPSCLNHDLLETFYQIKGIPVYQNRIYNTLQSAISCKRGDISLTFCHNCGMIFNSKFESKIMQYDQSYDNRQSASKYFRSYLDDIIHLIVHKYGIFNENVLEVGCGNGEFLELFCRRSRSKGIGFDPSYTGPEFRENTHFVPDYFNEKYLPVKADVLILRHILEHVDDPKKFLSTILQSIKVNHECKIIIEAPDFEWVSGHGAYWDVFYEHVNYFSKPLLKNLLESMGLRLIDIFNHFEGQYMIVIASFRPDSISRKETKKSNAASSSIICQFKRNVASKKKEVEHMTQHVLKGSPFTVWGAGAKGFTLLNFLEKDVLCRIPFVIDVNEAKQHNYCAGVGIEIMPPAILKHRRDIKGIFIMNPNYFPEISAYLAAYGRRFNLFSI